MNNNEDNELITRASSDAVAQDYVSAADGNLPQAAANMEQAEDEITLKVEELVKNDLATIRSLTGLGFLTREQGQTLMKQIIYNAYNNITKQHEKEPEKIETEEVVTPDAFAEFASEHPDFFNRNGRNEVLNYLKGSNVSLDKDELLQISKLIEDIENSAVERYLKKLEYGKTLNNENAIAKQRLRANAQNSNAADTLKVFTRAQIGNMSGDEFLKNEAAIMEQLRKGLIR